MFIDQLEPIMLLFYSVFRVVFYKKKVFRVVDISYNSVFLVGQLVQYLFFFGFSVF